MTVGSYTSSPPSATWRKLKHAASVACALGDLLYVSDTTNNYVSPAGQFSDMGTAAKTQRAFASRFAGLSNSVAGASNTGNLVAGVLLEQVVIDYPCESATFVEGDLVAISYNGGTLENQKVVKTTDATCAIGKVTKSFTSATTTVDVWFFGRGCGGPDADQRVMTAVQAQCSISTSSAGDGYSAAGGDGCKTTSGTGSNGGTAALAGGAGGAATTGTAGNGGAGSAAGGAGGTATGAAGVGGAGGTWGGSGGAGGAASDSSGGNAGAGGAATSRGGAGGAASGTTSAAGGAGGAWTGGGGAGGAAAGTSAAGDGGGVTLSSGAGGAKTGTGAASGGAGGALAVTGGNGGATASSSSNAAGAGGSITLTGGTGGNASAGTGNGGAGGDITLTPGAGGTSSGGTAGTRGVVTINGLRVAAGNTAVAITGATTLKLSDSGGIFTVAQSSAYAVTLPSPTTGAGTRFLFQLVSPGAFNVTLTVAGGAATFEGTIQNDVTSTLPATGGTFTWASGTAALGDWIEVISTSTSKYFARTSSSAAGGITIA